MADVRKLIQLVGIRKNIEGNLYYLKHRIERVERVRRHVLGLYGVEQAEDSFNRLLASDRFWTLFDGQQADDELRKIIVSIVGP